MEPDNGIQSWLLHLLALAIAMFLTSTGLTQLLIAGADAQQSESPEQFHKSPRVAPSGPVDRCALITCEHDESCRPESGVCKPDPHVAGRVSDNPGDALSC